MPVPTTIASLSTTASANPPAGNTPALPEMDDHIRQAYAFIRAVSDSVSGKLDASAVSAFMLTVLNDADAAAARTTLGAASLGANTFTGAQTLPGNAVNALEAVPKQQLDSRTILASGAEALAGTDAAKLLTPSTLRSGLNATGTAPVFAARAWGVFSGQTAGTFAPLSGGNVASITRTATGVYTVTFTTALPDASYTVLLSSNGAPGFNMGTTTVNSRAASSFSCTSIGTTGTTQAIADAGVMFFVVFE